MVENMGEAKSRLARLLSEQPTCVYCGGVVPATSRDHCPPIGMFDGGLRPLGLEFAACHDCHEGTRQMDLIVAMTSRIFPDPKTDVGRADNKKHIRGFINNHPELAGVFTSGMEQAIEYQGQTAYAIDLREQDRLQRAMKAFAARMGLALYREFAGKPAPTNAAIVARWYSNYELEHDAKVEEMLKSMGAPRTLRMGRKDVIDQFRYWGAITQDDPHLFGTFAAFRESFGTIAIIRTDGNLGEEAIDDNPNFFRPGFLKGFKV